MKYKYLLFLLFFWGNFAIAQNTATVKLHPNIIPNAGFEAFSAPPIGWFYKGDHFTKVMKYWSSATGASPDAFGKKVRVPEQWAAMGFGKKKPKNGLAMAGVTVYGCENGKPHCREYVQIELMEELVENQDYYVEFWVCHIPRSLRINNIGAAFTVEKVELITDDLLPFEPAVKAKDILSSSKQEWMKISGSFKATAASNYLVLGNFSPDHLTNTLEVSANSLPFAYYYIDDVLVRKQEPILPIPLKDDDLRLVELTAGKVIQLKNIFFETAKAELLPRSFVELNKLFDILEEHATLQIQINGHTDIVGGNAYNQDLSQKRAKAVVQFLIKKGIQKERLLFQGFGSTLPIAPNGTKEGRQMNRRVEFVVLSVEGG